MSAARGAVYTWTTIVRDGLGNLQDAPDLSLTATDPDGDTVAGFPVMSWDIVHDSLGTYHYDWTVLIGADLGTYEANWACTVDGLALGGSDSVEVVDAGSIDAHFLTVADYKELISTNAADAAIEAALAAAREAILDAGGPIGDVTEHIAGGHNHVSLGNRAAAIVSVAERAGLDYTALDPTDYELSASGGFVTRLLGGPNPSQHWLGQVEIVYETYIGDDTRKAVQAELAALDLGDSTGASTGARTSERIGEWSETFAASAVAQTPDDRRESILGRLNPQILTFWTSGGHSSTPRP